MGVHAGYIVRLSFLTSPTKSCDIKLQKALGAGVGDSADFICVIGIRNAGLIQELKVAGQPFLYFDKGYNRQWNSSSPQWWRVAVNAHQPTDYLMKMSLPGDRAREQGWKTNPWRANGPGRIIFAGSSEKYHSFHGLGDPNAYARHIIGEIRRVAPSRVIIYRPKPSWGQAEPVEGSVFHNRARHNIREDLADAGLLVTHGSNACFEALLMGVPSIILGDGVTRDISSRSLAAIEDPCLVPMVFRAQLLANLAYCQWSLDEIRSGKIWKLLDAPEILSLSA